MKKISKKAQQKENIFNHGLKLISIFNLKPFPETYPTDLCKRLHRIETKAHRIAEDYCNGIIEEQDVDKVETRLLKRLDDILNYKAQGIPIMFNGDPRGYTLKIESNYVRDNNIDIYKDWGGYGIICPEF